MPVLHFVAAASLIIAWGAFLGITRAQYSGPDLLAVFGISVNTVITFWGPGPGFILAVTASVLELIAGVLSLPFLWTEATVSPPAEPEPLPLNKRLGQYAVVLTGKIVWILDIASMWVAWYNWSVDTSALATSQTAGGGYTLLSGLWQCSTNNGHGPASPGYYCVVSFLENLPTDRSLNYPYVAGVHT
jgi:hypothetical protein